MTVKRSKLLVLAAIALVGALITIRVVDTAAPPAPVYMWLHFGPKAELRMLVRQDGEAVTLEHYAGGKPTGRKEQFADYTKFREVSIQDPDGKTSYVITGVTTLVEPGKPASLSFDVDIKGPVAYRQYGGGVPMANEPDKAPIAHFHGPLTIRAQLVNWETPRDLALQRGGTATYLRAFVGTFDRNKGCWVVVRSGVDAGGKKYPEFPKGVHPVVDVEFPPKNRGDSAVKQRYELNDFC
jgi:hypothetical protein